MPESTLVTVEPDVIPPQPFIVKGHIQVEQDFTADLVELVQKYPKEFQAAKEEAERTHYYQDWEAGSIFLHQLVEDAVDFSLYGGSGLKEGWSDIRDINFKWTKELAEQLELELSPKDDAASADAADN